MVTPVSSSAGFVAPDTVSPLIPGSDFAMFNSTNGGASTEMGSSFQITTSQFSWPIIHFFASPTTFD
jgi:hypothetical protein